jgi:hypothetical protein
MMRVSGSGGGLIEIEPRINIFHKKSSDGQCICHIDVGGLNAANSRAYADHDMIVCGIFN